MRGGVYVIHMAGGPQGNSEEVTRCHVEGGGVPVKRYQREYYYVCEGDQLAQTRLSFKRVASSDTRSADSNLSLNSTLISTSKEGQIEAGTDRKGMSVVDEK